MTDKDFGSNRQGDLPTEGHDTAIVSGPAEICWPRNEERAAERALNWSAAADLYAVAIAAYPIAQRKDGLAAADVANLENKRAQCLRMVAA
jgi:hypothetical protein